MKDFVDTYPNAQRSRFRKFLVWILWIGIFLVVFLVVLPKGYAWAKRLQSARLARVAIHHAEQGKMQEAMMSADTALRLNPNQPDALRFMAEMFEAGGRSSQAMELYGRAYASGRGTLDDLKKQALSAVKAGYIDPATRLSKLVAEKGEPDFPLVVEAQIKIHNEQPLEALTILRQAVSLRGSTTSRLALVRLLTAMPDVENRDLELGEQLQILKDGADEAALEALAIGISGDILPAETRLDWIKKIRVHPVQRLPLLLLADTIEAKLDPASKPRIAAGLVERVRGASLQDLLPAARWLLANGEGGRAVEILPLSDALTSADAMRVWVDLAAAIGQWDTMREALALSSNPLPAHFSKIYAARALKMSGRDATAAYREVLETYKDKPAEALDILAYLHRSQEYELFDSALPYQLSKAESAMSTMQSLVPVVAEARDSVRQRRLFQMAQQSSALQSNNSILNDAVYLDLILGKPVDTALLEARFKENPGDPAVRFTLALAKLQAGEKLPALMLIRQSKLTPQNLAANQLLILSCILAANNELEKAVALARLIPAANLSTQELEILKAHLLAAKPKENE